MKILAQLVFLPRSNNKEITVWGIRHATKAIKHKLAWKQYLIGMTTGFQEKKKMKHGTKTSRDS